VKKRKYEEEIRSAKAAKGQRAQRKKIPELGALCPLAALAHLFVIRRTREEWNRR
jgi:hypothetical protein